MSFNDCVFLILCAMMSVILLWRITCFFKKSCKWKKCPYRQEYHFSWRTGWLEMGCKKFPPTQEEIDEEDRMLDQLEMLIKQHSENNKNSEQ